MTNIFYLTAWASDKLYGKALNNHIRHLPDDSWIVVIDGDTCFLTDNYGKIIEQAIKDNPDVDLMTCRTNRAWGQGFDPQTNITTIRQSAHELSKRPNAYRDMQTVLPGFFWLFPKKTWIKHKFDEKPIIYKGSSFDARWSYLLLRDKMKMLMIENLYVFHYYRLHKDIRDTSHLK